MTVRVEKSDFLVARALKKTDLKRFTIFFQRLCNRFYEFVKSLNDIYSFLNSLNF